LGRRRAQQPRRPLLPEGPGRGCDRGIHAGARARPEDAGRAAQPRDRLSRHRLLRPACRPAAGAAAQRPGRPRRALGAGPRLRDPRRPGRRRRGVRAAAGASRQRRGRHHPARAGGKEPRAAGSGDGVVSAGGRARARVERGALLPGRDLLQPGLERRGARGAGAGGGPEPRQRQRPLPDGLRPGRPGSPSGRPGRVEARDPAESTAGAGPDQPLARALHRGAPEPGTAPAPRARAAGGGRERAGALQPRARVPAEGLLQRGAAGVPAGAGAGRGPAADAAIESFRTALRLQGAFSAARLNLALLLYQLRRFQLALEAYRQVLSGEPASAAAWNGVGLVLVELKRFPDARNAFVRAVEADPAHAGAHYNLSFTLSNLGDFDGALRATKRALELDPYYVSQKFTLTIDLQYEKTTIGIAPEISADVTAETIGEDFNFDQRLLDNIFQELAPAALEPPAGKAADDP